MSGHGFAVPARLLTEEFDEEDTPTFTSREQIECERMCAQYYFPADLYPDVRLEEPETVLDEAVNQHPKRRRGALYFFVQEVKSVLFSTSGDPSLLRRSHTRYLLNSLEGLNGNFTVLDASRTWLCYWIVHSLDLLDETPGEAIPRLIEVVLRGSSADFLTRRCQNESGGFGGGPQQFAHCAPTYSATLALVALSGLAVSFDAEHGTTYARQALEQIDRPLLYRFLWRMKQPSGGFAMLRGGEVDVRATYIAVCVATSLCMDTPELLENTEAYVARCQTYEGGFGGEPGCEAHGGYTFCGAATMHLLQRRFPEKRLMDHIDGSALLRWAVRRQMRLEGGFQGRTHKLVDGCYSFWQGAGLSLAPGGAHCLNRTRLQEYILRCGQEMSGGLRDKPSARRDLYHSCYCLSGLSIAQHDLEGNFVECLGDDSVNRVAATHPVFNVRWERVRRAQEYFSTLTRDHTELLRDADAKMDRRFADLDA